MDRYKRIAALPSETVGGDLLIVDGDRDLFFSANPIGAFIWLKLESPISLSELCDAVVAKFNGATKEVVEPDVLEFVESLKEQGIVEID